MSRQIDHREGQGKFLLHFVPLLSAKRGRAENEHTADATPEHQLAEHHAGLNSLAEADGVGQGGVERTGERQAIVVEPRERERKGSAPTSGTPAPSHRAPADPSEPCARRAAEPRARGPLCPTRPPRATRRTRHRSHRCIPPRRSGFGPPRRRRRAGRPRSSRGGCGGPPSCLARDRAGHVALPATFPLHGITEDVYTGPPSIGQRTPPSGGLPELAEGAIFEDGVRIVRDNPATEEDAA